MTDQQPEPEQDETLAPRVLCGADPKHHTTRTAYNLWSMCALDADHEGSHRLGLFHQRGEDDFTLLGEVEVVVVTPVV